jgi:hypothetical protein
LSSAANICADFQHHKRKYHSCSDERVHQISIELFIFLLFSVFLTLILVSCFLSIDIIDIDFMLLSWLRLRNWCVRVVNRVSCRMWCLIIVRIYKNNNTQKVDNNIFHEVKRYNIIDDSHHYVKHHYSYIHQYISI